jgi:hypothetical protein
LRRVTGIPLSGWVHEVQRCKQLGNAGRLIEALEWAHAALRDYEASENADAEIIKSTELIRRIESDLSKTQPQQ